MQLAYETLRLIADGKFHSGNELAQSLKVGRSTVWKAIDYLRTRGVVINAVSGKGYKLSEPLELVTKQQILAHLPPALHTHFPRIDALNTVSSTNDYLLERIHQLDSGSVCIALEQTQGKGRGGKVWYSPIGSNIYLSFNWRFSLKLHDLSGLSLIVALIVIDALKAYFKVLPPALGIKWPNDIWFEGKKLCGILIESISNNANLKNESQVVIGIGINLNMPEAHHQQYNLTDLNTIFGTLPSKNQLIALLLQQAALYLQKFQNEGLSAFSAQWAQFDLLAGKSIELSSPNHHETGIAAGISERGELLFRIGDTLKAVRYGEVSVVLDS